MAQDDAAGDDALGRPHLYALALGSNRSLSAKLTPRAIVMQASHRIGEAAGTVIALSPILTTPPLGPSLRVYANAALLLESDLPPDALLARLQTIEHAFGRRRHRRWGARSLDIDIILWSGGAWRSERLVVPHAAFRQRDFVLAPLAAIIPCWRDPWSGLSIRHLQARLARKRG